MPLNMIMLNSMLVVKFGLCSSIRYLDTNVDQTTIPPEANYGRRWWLTNCCYSVTYDDDDSSVAYGFFPNDRLEKVDNYDNYKSVDCGFYPSSRLEKVDNYDGDDTSVDCGFFPSEILEKIDDYDTSKKCGFIPYSSLRKIDHETNPITVVQNNRTLENKSNIRGIEETCFSISRKE